MSDLSYTVERMEAETTVQEYLRLCVDIPRFLECCKQCPNYGARWSCPPFDFDAAARWREYKTLRLYARYVVPGTDRSAKNLLDALAKEKSAFIRDLLALERATPGSLVLACGSCSLCTSCERAQGRPCRFPEQVRPSIESMGGDVGETASRYFGRPLLWVQGEEAPDYLTLVGGLLLREPAV